MMADHGAEVIRVESFAGEPVRNVGLHKAGHSVWFRNTHRGKKSLRLNLKDPRGKELLLRLLEGTDVLVEGFRPGVMERFGLDYPAVKTRAPQIIYCSLSSFGQSGRYRLKAAHDMVMQAMAGTLSFNLGRDGLPTNPSMPVADMTGSMMAFSGVLMALLRQRETGEGDFIDIAMHDCLMAWTANYTSSTFVEHRPPEVKQERNWGGAAFYNIYATADEDWIVLGGVEHNFCHAFLDKAGRLDLYDLCLEPPGPAQVPVKDFLDTFFAERTLAESLEWLSDVNVCYAPLRNLCEGIFDENTAEREMLLIEDGGIEHLGIPIKFAVEPGRVDFAVPELGEHSREIAATLGYSETEIDQFAAENVI